MRANDIRPATLFNAQLIVVLLVTLTSCSAALLPRSGQTDVICPDSFQWTNNRAGNNPCQVDAFLEGACYAGNWKVPKLQAGNHYDFYKDPCSCSWANYNLISACTACQGLTTSIQTWASVKASTNCSDLTSDTTFFPFNTPVQGGVLIPAWAATDPSTWQDGWFNVAQAEAIANKGLPDVDPSHPEVLSSKSSTPIGAIVGGVVGGVLVIAIGVGIALWMMIRRRRQAGLPQHSQSRPPHVRNISDMSAKDSLLQGNVVSLMSMPRQAHRSFPSIFARYAGSLYSSSRARSSPPAPEFVPDAIIEPFVVPPPSVSPPPSSPPTSPRMGTKMSWETTATPVNRSDDGHSSPTGKRRINPPAYTPSIQESSEPNASPISVVERHLYGHRQGRRGPGSQETQQSWDSVDGNRNTAASPEILSGHGRQTSNSTVGDNDIQIA